MKKLYVLLSPYLKIKNWMKTQSGTSRFLIKAKT